MALTRKQLKATGLTEEQIDLVIEAHAETVDALKAQLTEVQNRQSDYDSIRAELDSLKANGGNYEEKYNALKNEFDSYKAGIDAEKTRANKLDLLNAMLTEAGINRDSVRKLINQSYNLDSIVVEDGNVKDRESTIGKLKAEYADFIGSQQQQGVPTIDPPSGAGNKPMTVSDLKGMTAEQINANWESVKNVLQNK